jgi:AcrR family transcriptional regulator
MDRDHILEAAAQIFSEKGYHAASMQDIAEAVCLQKASLYHHVSSKQDILFDLLERALLGVMNWTITWYKPGGPLSAEQIANEYAELLLRGLLVRMDPISLLPQKGLDGDDRSAV